MNLAIISTNKEKYSETFIHNHVKLLPANIHFLFDGYLPQKYSTDKGVTSQSFLKPNSFKWFSFLKSKNSLQKEELEVSIKNYFLKNNIHLIFCEYGPSGVSLMQIAKNLNIPLVVHFHGYDAYRKDVLDSYGAHYPELFQIATAIIVPSKHMHSKLLELGCYPNKLHCLVYGIDTHIFNLNANQKKEKTLVACGRFVEKKAPQLTLKAFEKVIRKNPEARLTMIGDGELLNECMALTKQLGITSSVEFVGALNQSQIAEIFSKSLVFVQHSITTTLHDSEGTPLTILEAMSSGLPVISTKHGGIVDIVYEGKTGYLIQEGDVDAMAEKMLHLLQDPELAIQMGRSASYFVQEKHQLENYTKSIWTILKNSKF